MRRKKHREGSEVNETNLEKQLTRIADSLDSLVSIMQRAENLAQNVVASQKTGNYGQKNRR